MGDKTCILSYFYSKSGLLRIFHCVFSKRKTAGMRECVWYIKINECELKSTGKRRKSP